MEPQDSPTIHAVPDSGPGRRAALWAECLLLFFVIPPSLYFIRQVVAFKVVLLVLVFAGVCAWWLHRQPGFSWRGPGLGRPLPGVLLTFLAGAIPLTILAHLYLPERFFSFPAQKPWLWALVMLLYPLLAAWPQEIIFRAFFFRRYAPLFPHPAAMIAASAISFGLAHALYGNLVAPPLSALGGAVFAWRYQRHGSLTAAGLEHGLWGDFLFTSGLGWFIYSGAIA